MAPPGGVSPLVVIPSSQNSYGTDLWNGLGDKSLPLEDLRNLFKDRQSLLFEGRNVTADAAEDFGAVHTAEGAGDFLADFDPSHILFGLVVRLGNAEIPHK